jgi:hypothetical protein
MPEMVRNEPMNNHGRGPINGAFVLFGNAEAVRCQRACFKRGQII